MTPGPRPGNRTAWGGRLLKIDYAVLAWVFGFEDWRDFKQFADVQQGKANQRATRRA